MKADLVVYGGKIATDYGVFDGTVVIRDGRISALEDADGRGPDAEEKIDARGKIVIPGCVDAHCHFDEPSTEETREGFECGTRSAAGGDVRSQTRHGQSQKRDRLRAVGRADPGVDRTLARDA